MNAIGPSHRAPHLIGDAIATLDGHDGTMTLTDLDRSLLPLLDEIVSFRPVAEHVRELELRFGEVLTRREIERALQAFVDAGLVESFETLSGRVQTGRGVATAKYPGDAAPPLAFMAIPTSKSWREIDAVVRSTVAAIGSDGPPLLVSFQGARPDDVPNSPPATIVDSASIRRSVEPYLAECAPADRAVIERALGLNDSPAWRAGTNRNRLLLLGAGRRFLSGDDDQPSRFVEFSNPHGELRVTSRPSPSDYAPLESIDERDARYTRAQRDPIALHAEWLSRSLPEILGGRPAGSVRIEDATRRLIACLEEPDRRVRATMLGLAGDIGQRTPLLLLTEAHPARGSLRKEALLSGVGVAAAPCLTISDRPYFRTSHAAYDNRTPLPPFPSVGRNGDGVFGAALSQVFGPGTVLHLPYAIEHYAKPGGPLTLDALSDAGYRENDLLVLAILTAPSVASWASLAEYLVALGNGPRATAVELLTRHMVAQTNRILRACDERIAAGTLGDAAERARDGVYARLESGSFLRADLDWNAICGHIAEYGRLMQLWPALHRWASERPIDLGSP